MYNLFDTHCDTAYDLYYDSTKGTFRENNLHFSLKNTLTYNKYVQVFALWSNPKYDNEEALEVMMGMFSGTLKSLEEQHIDLIKDASDFDFETGFKGIIGMEGGRALYNDIDNLHYFYEKGMRCLTLTWNGENLIGFGSDVCEDKGLTEYGKQIVKEINSLKMITDVSHLNIQGFYDVCELSEKPFIASHSNSRAVCNHVRNLTDEQFKMLIEKNGVTGINLHLPFLAEDGNGTISDVIRHIDHFMELGGEDNIGIGSDFDGIPAPPQGLENNGELYKIFNELTIRGYTREQIEKISYGNFERVFKESLK